MTKPKVLVAGRSGQVARELARTVPGGIGPVAFLGRPDLDICDREAVCRAISEFGPDVVINAAAYTAVDQAESDEATVFAVNAEAAGTLSEAAAAAGAPILHLSTDYVFDGSKPSPYTEEDPVAPLGAYGRSKLEGEKRVAGANARHVILRTAWVYSPFGRNFVKTMLRLAESRDEVGVVDDQIGNPTSASDIARTLWQIAADHAPTPEKLPPGLFHMTASGEASWADFAQTIFHVSASLGGPSAGVRRITTADYPTQARRPANSRLDCARLKLVYGITLPDWRASARACVAELMETKGWHA